MGKKDVSPFMFHTMICGIIFFGIALYHWYFPVSYNYFLAEDSWVEYGTFACYLTAGLLVLSTIMKNPPARRPGYILLCLGLFFVAMEEISWGQRLFGVRTPDIIAQLNYQSELSLHNASFFPAEHLFFHAILVWAIILPEISCRFKRLGAFLKAAGIPLVSREIYPYFILGFLLKNFKVVIKNAELGEFIIGLAFLLFSVGTFSRIGKNAEETKLVKKRFIGWAVMIVATVTALMVFAGPQDIYALRRLLHKSAIAGYPRYGMNAQAKKIFEYLVQHEELKNDDTLFQYGIFLKKTKNPGAETIFLRALQESRERIRLNPEKPAPNLLAGRIYKQLNQLDLAEKEFQEALRKDQIRLAKAELNWQKVDALKSMGETYLEMEKHDLAAEYLQKAFDYAEDGLSKAKIKNLLETIDRP